MKEMCGEGTEVLMLTESEKLLAFCTYAEKNTLTFQRVMLDYMKSMGMSFVRCKRILAVRIPEYTERGFRER